MWPPPSLAPRLFRRGELEGTSSSPTRLAIRKKTRALPYSFSCHWHLRDYERMGEKVAAAAALESEIFRRHFLLLLRLLVYCLTYAGQKKARQNSFGGLKAQIGMYSCWTSVTSPSHATKILFKVMKWPDTTHGSGVWEKRK